MAKVNNVKEVVKKNSTRQRIIVEQGRAMFEPFVPYKVLHKETVESKEAAIDRVKELKEEYKDVDAVSINYFSL